MVFDFVVDVGATRRTWARASRRSSTIRLIMEAWPDAPKYVVSRGHGAQTVRPPAGTAVTGRSRQRDPIDSYFRHSRSSAGKDGPSDSIVVRDDSDDAKGVRLP